MTVSKRRGGAAAQEEDVTKNSRADAKQKRSGAAASIGQVPTDSAGRRRDLMELNEMVQHTLLRGKRLGVLDNDLQVRPLTDRDLHTVIAEFGLAPTYREDMPSKQRKLLFPMPHLGPIRERSSEKIQQLIRQGEVNMEKTAKRCVAISSQQKQRKIQLRFSNLLTLFKDRWLDSVVLDAYLHILQEFWPFKHVLYLNSSETDPSLMELRNTPTCFPYVLSVLFYKSHWTVIMIDHVKMRIRYLNSQVVDHTLPDRQAKPFQDLFPRYHVQNVTHSQQCNQSDCGVYSAAWMMLYLYYNENDFNQIQCDDMYQFRREMLEQLILYYYLADMSGSHHVVNDHRISL